MIRRLLYICLTIYFGYYVFYPYVQFDTTEPSVELLSKKIGKDYFININEKNLIKIEDDHGLKDVILYFSNKDTNDKFEKMYYSSLNGNSHILDLNDTILKKVLSSYISKIKLKIVVADASMSNNTTEKILSIKLDNKKPHIEVLNKSLYSLNKGSLIAVKLKTFDNESSIKQITVNNSDNFTILPSKDKNIFNLLIPADENIIKSKKIRIESEDTVGNTNALNTYFLTKNNSETYIIDNKQNIFFNIIESLKIKLEKKNVSIVKLYHEDLEIINNVILNISKEINAPSFNVDTLINADSPVINNDKINVINFNDNLMLGNSELNLNGEFYNANIYQELVSPLDGKIVFMDNLNILGNTIIIKNNNGLYTILSSIKEFNKDLVIGKMIKKGNKVGLPVRNDIFGSNFYFSVNLNGKYIKPFFFFNNSYYKNYINKVFEKGN